jgi:hypothetical protein
LAGLKNVPGDINMVAAPALAISAAILCINFDLPATCGLVITGVIGLLSMSCLTSGTPGFGDWEGTDIPHINVVVGKEEKVLDKTKHN